MQVGILIMISIIFARRNITMEDIALNELNAVLKGEQMAIDAYERYIQELEDDHIKEVFQHIQQDHKRHASELAERIQTLGGSPEYNTGFAGFMASARATMEGIGSMDRADILKKAYDGEDKGIAMAEEIIKGDLDKESMGLVKQILSEDHNHLRRMVRLIGEYEIKH